LWKCLDIPIRSITENGEGTIFTGKIALTDDDFRTFLSFYHTKTYNIFIERTVDIILCSFAIAILSPNRSLWLDFVILAKTVKAVWRGEGV